MYSYICTINLVWIRLEPCKLCDVFLYVLSTRRVWDVTCMSICKVGIYR